MPTSHTTPLARCVLIALALTGMLAAVGATAGPADAVLTVYKPVCKQVTVPKQNSFGALAAQGFRGNAEMPPDAFLARRVAPGSDQVNVIYLAEGGTAPLNPKFDIPNYHGSSYFLDGGQNCVPGNQPEAPKWQAVVDRPQWIGVPPGYALVFREQGTPQKFGKPAPWGAVQVSDSPGLIPDPSDPKWATASIDMLPADVMLKKFDSCRACVFKPGTTIAPSPDAPHDPSMPFAHDLAGAQLRSGKLSGDLSGWSFARANLDGVSAENANLAGADLVGASLSVNRTQGELRAANLTGANLTGADLNVTNLTEADMRAAKLAGATFQAADLRSANLAGQDLTRVTLTAANLTGANLSNADLHGLSWDSRDLKGVDLDGANLTGTFLRGANLAGATVDHTIVSNAHFDYSNLTGTHLSSLQYAATSAPQLGALTVGCNGNARCGPDQCTRFHDVDLTALRTGFSVVRLNGTCGDVPMFPGSTLPLGLRFGDGAADLRRVDFADARFVVTAGDRSALAGADLQGVNLDRVQFGGFPPDFKGTNFSNASLKGTNLELANLAGAKFNNADAKQASFVDASLPRASFAGGQTQLLQADFSWSDISGASFQSADLSGAVFNDALAHDTDFNSVVAKKTSFHGAHIYGRGNAFQQARNLQGADFTDAVLAGDISSSSGLDFTQADLAGAHFDGAQCVSCDFVRANLSDANLSDAYLPGAVLQGATLEHAILNGAWLYCGDTANSLCGASTDRPGLWNWPLSLGSNESFGPVAFASTKLSNGSLDKVTSCPDGRGPAGTGDCADGLVPRRAFALPGCSAAGADVCAAPTGTLLHSTDARPLSVVAATPANLVTTSRSSGGYYVGLSNGTIELIGANGQRKLVARGFNTPGGLAVGPHGSVYVADSGTHDVVRIWPDGKSERLNESPLKGGPYGVAVNADGEVFAAAGQAGVWSWAPGLGGGYSFDACFTQKPNPMGPAFGPISVPICPAPAKHPVYLGVAIAASGDLYATTTGPSQLLKIPLPALAPNSRLPGLVHSTRVAGTTVSGYNGNTDSRGRLLPGDQVQLNGPAGVSIARNGDVVFADRDNGLIRAYVPSSGHVIDLAGRVSDDGDPQIGFDGDGHFSDQTMLNGPADVTTTRDGRIIVADTGNDRVRNLTPAP